MTSIIRSSIGTGAALVLIAALATGASPASAAPAAPVGAAAPSPSAAPAGAPATATPRVTPAASPKPTASPKPAASATPAPSATPSVNADPSLKVMNAQGNHTMGSTIPGSLQADGGASAKSAAPRAQSRLQTAVSPAPGIDGLDVSAYQPSIDWASVYGSGARFAYIKATEGTTYQSRTFAAQYAGSYNVGMIRGAYHFATPNTSSGADQARYFAAHGGSWTADGHTLPPLLDIEYGYNGTCWGLSKASMVSWIRDFTNTMLALTGTQPAIYSTTDWWSTCTGNSNAFASNPLFVARYTSATSPGTLPASWKTYTFWQWDSAGFFPGDQDVFNGTMATLKLAALGGYAKPVTVPAPNSGAMLAPGASLKNNAKILSSNGQYDLTMASNGNAVLHGNGRVLWQSRTGTSPGARLTMQSDGNAVIYSTAGKALWSSGTEGSGANSRLVVQASGDLQVTNSTSILWNAGAIRSDILMSGYVLGSGQYLHDSTGLLRTVMQSDGNLVVYLGARTAWNSHTSGHPGSRLVLQSDGNLVIYDKSGRALWNTHTNKVGSGTQLAMRSDGDLVLTKAGKAAWDTKTKL